MPKIELIQGDCLEVMKNIPDGSVDCVITDPPYGQTGLKWDSVIPFEQMWTQQKRIVKKNRAIVLFGMPPFSSALVMSNPKWFKYEWVWEKTRSSNFLCYKFMPARTHENILVFGTGRTTYIPQMTAGKPYFKKRGGARINPTSVVGGIKETDTTNNGTRYPRSIQKFANGNFKSPHTTQKPVALLEYLLKTYTNEGETVLDFAMGSGSTGVACKNLNRSFIGIELDKEYFEEAKDRINKKILIKGKNTE